MVGKIIGKRTDGLSPLVACIASPRLFALHLVGFRICEQGFQFGV